MQGVVVKLKTLNITFQGDWKYPFDETNTQDQDFYVTPDKTVKVPMMYQKNKFLYAESQELQAQVGNHKHKAPVADYRKDSEIFFETYFKQMMTILWECNVVTQVK